MKRKTIPLGPSPERKIQDNIILMLTRLKWVVKETHGNMYQAGFPDLYATHAKFGPRWIEVKNEPSYSFTPAQKITFPMFSANGSPIWIMFDATHAEYMLLFKPENWKLRFK